MTDSTNAQRQRDWYQRKQAGIIWTPLVCQACGNNCSGKYDPLCSRCQERLTPSGREARAARARKLYHAKRQTVKSDSL